MWKDSGLQIPVAFAPEAMEQIRRAAVEGMLSLRRVGVGVGGLLLGQYGDGQITILDSREIACAHNFGPSFRLTAEEIAAALAPIDGTGELEVVGLYCSKPRGPAEVDDDDRRLFESLCPERWQAMLVVSPKSNDASMGAIFSRGEGRALLGGAQLPIEESRAAPGPVEPPAVAAAPPIKPKIAPKIEPASLADPVTAKPVSARPATLPEIIPEPEAPPLLSRKAAPRPKAPPERVAARRPDVPLFSPTLPVKRAALSPWMLWGVSAAIFVALCIAAFLTRDRWMPRQPLELRSFDSGGILTVEWNRSAVRDVEGGSLLFTDGTETKTFLLNGAQVHSGWFQYPRKSAHVAVIFRAGSMQETTTYNDKPLGRRPLRRKLFSHCPPRHNRLSPDR